MQVAGNMRSTKVQHRPIASAPMPAAQHPPAATPSTTSDRSRPSKPISAVQQVAPPSPARTYTAHRRSSSTSSERSERSHRTFTCSNQTQLAQLLLFQQRLGARVVVGGDKLGILRFVGSVHVCPQGIFCGVELVEPLGKHDGSVDGKRYFQCRQGFGIFAAIEKVELCDEDQNAALGAINVLPLSGSKLQQPSSVGKMKRTRHLTQTLNSPAEPGLESPVSQSGIKPPTPTGLRAANKMMVDKQVFSQQKTEITKKDGGISLNRTFTTSTISSDCDLGYATDMTQSAYNLDLQPPDPGRHVNRQTRIEPETFAPTAAILARMSTSVNDEILTPGVVAMYAKGKYAKLPTAGRRLGGRAPSNDSQSSDVLSPVDLSEVELELDLLASVASPARQRRVVPQPSPRMPQGQGQGSARGTPERRAGGESALITEVRRPSEDMMNCSMYTSGIDSVAPPDDLHSSMIGSAVDMEMLIENQFASLDSSQLGDSFAFLRGSQLLDSDFMTSFASASPRKSQATENERNKSQNSSENVSKIDDDNTVLQGKILNAEVTAERQEIILNSPAKLPSKSETFAEKETPETPVAEGPGVAMTTPQELRQSKSEAESDQETANQNQQPKQQAKQISSATPETPQTTGSATPNSETIHSEAKSPATPHDTGPTTPTSEIIHSKTKPKTKRREVSSDSSRSSSRDQSPSRKIGKKLQSKPGANVKHSISSSNKSPKKSSKSAPAKDENELAVHKIKEEKVEKIAAPRKPRPQKKSRHAEIMAKLQQSMKEDKTKPKVEVKSTLKALIEAPAARSESPDGLTPEAEAEANHGDLKECFTPDHSPGRKENSPHTANATGMPSAANRVPSAGRGGPVGKSGPPGHGQLPSHSTATTKTAAKVGLVSKENKVPQQPLNSRRLAPVNRPPSVSSDARIQPPGRTPPGKTPDRPSKVANVRRVNNAQVKDSSISTSVASSRAVSAAGPAPSRPPSTTTSANGHLPSSKAGISARGPGGKVDAQLAEQIEEQKATIAKIESDLKQAQKCKKQDRARIFKAENSLEAMLVLVKYLSEELEAFSVPSLRAKLRLANTHLAEAKCTAETASKQREDAQQELRNVIDSHAKALNCLQEEHEKSLQELRATIAQEYEATARELTLRHQKELDALNKQHATALDKTRKELELQLRDAVDDRIKEVEDMKKKQRRQLEEIERSQEKKVKDLESTFSFTMQNLEGKLLEMEKQRDAYRKDAAHLQETLLRDADAKVQMAVAKFKDLPQEIESLKVVLEMRNKEIHSLRSHASELERQAEDNSMLAEKLRTVEAKYEQLKEVVNVRKNAEKNLSHEQRHLKDTLEQEAKERQRLSMQNDELRYKLEEMMSQSYSQPSSSHCRFSSGTESDSDAGIHQQSQSCYASLPFGSPLRSYQAQGSPKKTPRDVPVTIFTPTGVVSSEGPEETGSCNGRRRTSSEGPTSYDKDSSPANGSSQLRFIPSGSSAPASARSVDKMGSPGKRRSLRSSLISTKSSQGSFGVSDLEYVPENHESTPVPGSGRPGSDISTRDSGIASSLVSSDTEEGQLMSRDQRGVESAGEGAGHDGDTELSDGDSMPPQRQGAASVAMTASCHSNADERPILSACNYAQDPNDVVVLRKPTSQSSRLPQYRSPQRSTKTSSEK